MLPSSIVDELNNFFNKNVDWLEQAYLQINFSAEDAKIKALQTLSLLEGAMLICTSKKDISFFDLSTQSLIAEITS